MEVSARTNETRQSQSNNKIRRCHPCVRFSHIFFSIILALYGAALLLMTITVKFELQPYSEFLHYYLETPILVIMFGCITLIGIGSLGFISSASLIYGGIVTSGIFTFGLLLFKLSMGIIVLITLSSAERSIREALQLSVANYTMNSEPMDKVQKNLYCCGVIYYTDWNSTLGYIPGSCCGSDTTCEPADVIKRSSIGCHEALVDLVNFYMRLCVLTLAVLIAIEMAAIVVTVLLSRNIKKLRKEIPSYEENRNEVEEQEIPRAMNPMAVRKDLLESNRSTKRRASPLPERKTSDSRVRLPERRLASFNYQINSKRLIPTAPPMPIDGQKYPRIF